MKITKYVEEPSEVKFYKRELGRNEDDYFYTCPSCNESVLSDKIILQFEEE